ncbi:MAG TPA: hypothetical protein ENN69_05605 [Spirochaetia bacterium]|nr:hypothetical protein [Spirochaetia bacterium]
MRVTEVLKNCNLRAWPGYIKPEDMEFYLNRGRAIHRATALYDLGRLDWPSVDPRIEPFVQGWVKFRKEVGGVITAIEQPVSNIALGYTGTFDRIISKCALHPTGNLLIDIKTNEADIYTRLQTAAYALAQKKKVKRGYVSLFETGKYTALVYGNDASDIVAWKACIQLNNWIGRNTR